MVGEGCIFCSIARGEERGVLVYKDDRRMVLMDKYPINRGHALVLPTKHYDLVMEMPLGEAASLFALAVAVAKAVRIAVRADGINIGQNNGAIASQEVPHVHIHVIPRFVNDSEDGSFWPKRKMMSYEELEGLAKEIKRELLSILQREEGEGSEE